MALVAYEVPETSPVGYLLSSEYSESVGLRLNSAILGKRERERRRGRGEGRGGEGRGGEEGESERSKAGTS